MKNRWLIVVCTAVISMFATSPAALFVLAEDEKSLDDETDVALRMVTAYMEKSLQNISLKTIQSDVRLMLGHKFSNDSLDTILKQAASEASRKIAAGSVYADRHLRKMKEIVDDPDCKNLEFNVQDETYRMKDAARTMRKCKLVVLRNVFDHEFLMKYKTKFTRFMNGLNQKLISREGSTSNGEDYYMSSRGPGRFEITLPRSLAHEDLSLDENVSDMLAEEEIFGEGLNLHSLGANAATPGAAAQEWHTDMPSLYPSSTETHGIGGHDFPAYAITMLIPMMNLTRAHGPTEFCIGSSAMLGAEEADFWDKSLQKDPDWIKYEAISEDDVCPPERWRSPLVNFGDVVFFDYQLTHRGGQNDSDEMRAVVYATYSRRWFKDDNFCTREFDEPSNDEEYYGRFIDISRFSEPDIFELKEDTDLELTRLEDIRNFMKLPTTYHVDPGDEREFGVSNRDLDEVRLFVGEKELIPRTLRPGDTTLVNLEIGAKLDIRGVDGVTLLHSVTIHPEQRQLILEKIRLSKKQEKCINGDGAICADSVLTSNLGHENLRTSVA